jgi:hypothetical protein
MRRSVFIVMLLMTCLTFDRSLKAQESSARANAKPKTEAAHEQAKEVLSQTDEAPAQGKDPQAEKEEGKVTAVPGGKALGMSILGNQEAPKSLVIVPWKTSELGKTPSASPMLDDSRQPVDKEVFMRALLYYKIRSETKP